MNSILNKILTVSLLFVVVTSSAHTNTDTLDIDSITTNEQILDVYNQIFTESSKPTFEAFRIGFVGYAKMLRNKRVIHTDVLTIIDFSLPSTVRRLWVLDVPKRVVVFNSLVAHGKNSGENMASTFSNIPNSKMSSPGFYITGETYYGKHGYSLRIDGIEKGINDKARERAIVIHGAEYVSRGFVKTHGRLGRSFGCPALPVEKNDLIINTIKGKTCLFIYAPKKHYKSKYVA